MSDFVGPPKQEESFSFTGKELFEAFLVDTQLQRREANVGAVRSFRTYGDACKKSLQDSSADSRKECLWTCSLCASRTDVVHPSTEKPETRCTNGSLEDILHKAVK